MQSNWFESLINFFLLLFTSFIIFWGMYSNAKHIEKSEVGFYRFLSYTWKIMSIFGLIILCITLIGWLAQYLN